MGILQRDAETFPSTTSNQAPLEEVNWTGEKEKKPCNTEKTE
jgi:hypothetical protein